MKYLGQKGYTIAKNLLSESEKRELEEELTVTPMKKGPIVIEQTYLAFRESTTKYYVPRYYGIEKFGQPVESRLPEGCDIDVTFTGTLRPEQEVAVSTYMSKVRQMSFGGGGL